MDAPWPSSAFMAVKSRLDVRELTAAKWRRASDTPKIEWATVECASKKAHGCGKHGQKIVEGLTLYVRRPDLASSPSTGCPDLTSAVAISLSAEGARSVEAEVGSPGGELQVRGSLMTVHRQLLVLLVGFRGLDNGNLTYYLVYDSTDASLHMIPYLPAYLNARYTLAPVPVNSADGLKLVLMAREIGSRLAGDGDVVCLCTPATRANPASGTWQMKPQRFPKLPRPFKVEETFSLGGMAFWADLSQGLVYCNLLEECSVVDFQFIKLPHGYEINYYSETTEYMQAEPLERRTTRTIGCVGSSIKFVCIDSRRAHRGHEIVMNVWTLDLQQRFWKRDGGFPCPWNEFSKCIGFMSATELRDVELLYPTLMPDGALCFLLRWRDWVRAREEPCYICSFDMRLKSSLWFGLVRHHSATGPFILPCNFFTEVRRPTPQTSEEAAKRLDTDAGVQTCGCSVPRRQQATSDYYPRYSSLGDKSYCWA
ncbi:hypothetical protein EJB05_04004 [Eragrostis curvula]|uniref:DUF1618 domain-containing protein n=1 Tax=Eragrostis curvula TaxID=38414 RepID=A0A5J9W8C3_9POAL|nr:hypothetical protein EJB05_04004 [Eragrostis curvula]